MHHPFKIGFSFWITTSTVPIRRKRPHHFTHPLTDIAARLLAWPHTQHPPRSLPEFETEKRETFCQRRQPTLLLVHHQSKSRELSLQLLPRHLRLLFRSRQQHQVSSPGESHPEALSEPCLNVSAHTAPAMEPRRTPICQCAHNFGSRLEIRATQCVALRKCLRSFLYFRSAQRANDRSSCRIGG